MISSVSCHRVTFCRNGRKVLQALRWSSFQRHVSIWWHPLDRDCARTDRQHLETYHLRNHCPHQHRFQLCSFDWSASSLTSVFCTSLNWQVRMCLKPTEWTIWNKWGEEIRTEEWRCASASCLTDVRVLQRRRVSYPNQVSLHVISIQPHRSTNVQCLMLFVCNSSAVGHRSAFFYCCSIRSREREREKERWSLNPSLIAECVNELDWGRKRERERKREKLI